METNLLDRGPGRPVHRLLAALFALAAGAALAFAGAGAQAGSGSSLTFKQSVTSAHFKAENLSELAPGSGFMKLCWEIAPKTGDPHIWCVSRKSPDSTDWSPVGHHRGTKARMTADSALLAVDPQVAGLPPGLYKWDVALTPCAGGASDSTSSTDAPCAVRHPADGGQTVRIHSLKAAGCKANGPDQVISGSRHSKKIALTFDDGPADDTPQFLDELKRLKIPATFFMIGQQVHAHTAVLKRMLREGHEIGNHTWSHVDVSGAGGAAHSQLVETNHAIEHASGGYRPCLMRPPGGSTSAALGKLARSLEMTSVLWDVDPQDWRDPGTATIVANVRAHTQHGSIILEHDGGGNRTQTLAALPQYVKTLKKRGYKFVTVSELLGYKTVFALNQ